MPKNSGSATCSVCEGTGTTWEATPDPLPEEDGRTKVEYVCLRCGGSGVTR